MEEVMQKFIQLPLCKTFIPHFVFLAAFNISPRTKEISFINSWILEGGGIIPFTAYL